jgi:hypothetical protein
MEKHMRTDTVIKLADAVTWEERCTHMGIAPTTRTRGMPALVAALLRITKDAARGRIQRQPATGQHNFRDWREIDLKLPGERYAATVIMDIREAADIRARIEEMIAQGDLPKGTELRRLGHARSA